ncbi:MAG: hypothetical protein ACI8RZ_002873 [Myxococcota bacterium]|jgi:hypothetical protein
MSLELWLLVGCSGSEPEVVRDSAEVPLSLSLLVTDNPYNPLSAVATVTASQDATVAITASSGSRSHTTPMVVLEAGMPTEVLMLGLRADQTWSLMASGEGAASAVVEVAIAALPAGYPACEVTVDAGAVVPEDEVVCTNGDTTDGGIYFCMDRTGEIVWAVSQIEAEGVHAFRMLSDGTLAMLSDTRSMVSFLTDRGEPIVYYTPSWFKDRTRFFHEWIDLHEVIEITEGPWAGAVAILTATYEHPDSKVPDTRGPGIIVFDRETGEVLWDWLILGEDLEDGLAIDDKIDLERTGLYSSPANFFHGNALLHRVEDGRDIFWMSLRHQDWLIKIDAETDAVLWRLGREGDFTLVDDLDAATPQLLPDDDWMYQQHAPEWQHTDGDRTALVLFDNGLRRPAEPKDSYSRVLGFEIDESTMTAAPTFAFGSGDVASGDHFFSTGVGDADVTLGGDRLYFVKGYGPDPFLAEVGYPDGGLSWKLVCPDQDELYRLSHYPSLYEMTWKTD